MEKHPDLGRRAAALRALVDRDRHQRFFKSALPELRKAAAFEAKRQGWSPSREDTDDLTQEMALRVWRGFDQYDSMYERSTWYRAIARSVVGDHLRKRRRHALTREEPHDVRLATDSPVATAELGEILKLLAHRVSLEGADTLLRYIGGDTIAELSERKEIRAQSVRQRVKRAREQLRSLL